MTSSSNGRGRPCRADTRPDRPRAWTLLIDGAPQSHVDLDDPADLSFEYQRRLGHVIDLVAPPGKPVHAVHLGGGALTLARYTAATRPRRPQQVVERDGALVQLVRRELPLDRNPRIRVRSLDAREGLAEGPRRLGGPGDSGRVRAVPAPPHLTSVEFLTDVRRTVKPGGLYAANLAYGPPLAHLRGQIATAATVFPELALIADPTVLRGKRFGNAVLVVASGHPLPLAELTRRAASDLHPARLEHRQTAHRLHRRSTAGPGRGGGGIPGPAGFRVPGECDAPQRGAGNCAPSH